MNWVKESVMYNIYPLGFCGAPRENDGQTVYRLNKIYDWIDNFKKLNVNAIVFNPVFQSSRHGYDTIDYYNIDCRLGDNNSFKEICGTLRKNGIKVILDGVFNHVGRDFKAFKDVRQNREGSKYCSWFKNLNFNGNTGYNDGFGYEGWAGHYDLVKLNLDNKEVTEHLLNAVKFWIEEFDIDGLRLDAADCVDLGFFRELRSLCHNLKPDFWLYGEITSGDYNRWANDSTLHSVTNYECYKALFSSHNDRNYFEIAHNLNRQFGDGGIYKNIYTFNFADNHDVTRIVNMLINRRHLKNVYTLLYTVPGVPCLYYGSEFAVEGRRTNHSDYDIRPCLDIDNIPNPDYELYNHICRLGKIRKALPALKYGDYRNVNIKNEQLIFSRKYQGQIVYIALNLSESPADIDFNAEGNGYLTDVLNNNEKQQCNGYSVVHLEPCSAKILVLNDGSFSIRDGEEPEDKEDEELAPITAKIGKYRHFKGNEYMVTAIARDSETLEDMVVYRSLSNENEIWVRKRDNFEELVHRDGKTFRRFDPIGN